MKQRIILFTAALIVTFASGLFAEHVFTKDGSILSGKITNENKAAIVIVTEDKKKHTVKRTDIMRILYTKLYMGKIYVQLTNGKNEVCYMVDEDSESYTFRKDLYRPEEFKLKRDQVLFIARGNPSGLEGEAGTDRVELTWYPPYNGAKKYRIYMRVADEKEFKLADETGSKSITIKGLKSYTKYFFSVTAIDANGDESPPSNELEIMTKNILPSTPEKITVTEEAGDDMGYSVLIKWNQSTDEDGSVTGYNIYRRGKEKTEKIGTTKMPEFRVKDLVAGEDYVFEVRAVDDRNDESDDAGIARTGVSMDISCEISGSYIMVSGKMAEMFTGGYGATLSVYVNNIFYVENFDAGLLGAFWYFDPNDADIKQSYMVPVQFALRYRIPLVWGFFLAPVVSGGTAYNSVTSMQTFSLTTEKRETTDSAFEPMAIAGLDLIYMLNDSVRFSAGCSYIALYEPDKRFDMLKIDAGVQIVF